MSVSQYPASKRFAALLVFAVLTLVALCAASQASAESTVYSHPQTNVFFRFGVGSGSKYYTYIDAKKYTYTWQIYRNGKWVNTSSIRFGYLNTLANKRGEEISVFLKLVPYEQVVDIDTEYQLTNGTQIPFRWDGKGYLPIHRRFGKHEATLEYVDVGVHSPELPEQPKEPEYTEMH
jgi:hypothetical protein